MSNAYWRPDQFDVFKREASQILSLGVAFGVLPAGSASTLRFHPEFDYIAVGIARVVAHFVDLHDPIYADRVHPSDRGSVSAVVNHQLLWIHPSDAPVNVDKRELRRLARQPGGARQVFDNEFNRFMAHLEADCDRRETLRPPRQRPRVSGMTPTSAEHLACEWMRHLGIRDAAVTQQSVDGGVDVTSATVVAQVKHYKAPVGVEPLRALHGVATVTSRNAAFFTLTGYTKRAVDFGNDARMPLFIYDPVQADLQGANPLAHLCLSAGFSVLTPR